MHNTFRIVGWIEGISLLALFFYAMPLKYVWGDPSMVRTIGAVHGALFLGYVLCAFILYDRENWPRKQLVWALVLSSVPFGTFYFNPRYLTRA
jgi:integral membrane protein